MHSMHTYILTSLYNTITIYSHPWLYTYYTYIDTTIQTYLSYKHIIHRHINPYIHTNILMSQCTQYMQHCMNYIHTGIFFTYQHHRLHINTNIQTFIDTGHEYIHKMDTYINTQTYIHTPIHTNIHTNIHTLDRHKQYFNPMQIAQIIFSYTHIFLLLSQVLLFTW